MSLDTFIGCLHTCEYSTHLDLISFSLKFKFISFSDIIIEFVDLLDECSCSTYSIIYGIFIWVSQIFKDVFPNIFRKFSHTRIIWRLVFENFQNSLFIFINSRDIASLMINPTMIFTNRVTLDLIARIIPTPTCPSHHKIIQRHILIVLDRRQAYLRNLINFIHK